MAKARPTPASFTVRLGHPLLILFSRVWMVLLIVILGVYFTHRMEQQSEFRSRARQ